MLSKKAVINVNDLPLTFDLVDNKGKCITFTILPARKRFGAFLNKVKKSKH